MTLKYVEDFLTTLFTSPGIALSLKVKAAGPMRGVIGRIIGQGTVGFTLPTFKLSKPRTIRWAYPNISVYLARSTTSTLAVHDPVTKWAHSPGPSRNIFPTRQLDEYDLRGVGPSLVSLCRLSILVGGHPAMRALLPPLPPVADLFVESRPKDSRRQGKEPNPQNGDDTGQESPGGGHGVDIAVSDRCQGRDPPPHRVRDAVKHAGLCLVFQVIHDARRYEKENGTGKTRNEKLTPLGVEDPGESLQIFRVVSDFKDPEDPEQPDGPEHPEVKCEKHRKIEWKDRKKVHCRHEGEDVTKSWVTGTPIIGTQIGCPDSADVFQGEHRNGKQFKFMEELGVLLMNPVGGFEDHRQYVQDNQADRKNLEASVVTTLVPDRVEEDFQFPLQAGTSLDLT